MSYILRVFICFSLLVVGGCGRDDSKIQDYVNPKEKIAPGFQCGFIPDALAEDLLGRGVRDLFDQADAAWLRPEQIYSVSSSCRAEEKESPLSYLDITLSSRYASSMPKPGGPRILSEWEADPKALRLPASFGEGYFRPDDYFVLLRKCTDEILIGARMYAYSPRTEAAKWDPVFRAVVARAEELYKCTAPRLPKDATLADAKPFPRPSPSPVSS